MLSNRPVVTANVLKQLWGLQIRSATDNISPKHFKRLKLGEKNTDYFLDSILVNLYKKKLWLILCPCFTMVLKTARLARMMILLAKELAGLLSGGHPFSSNMLTTANTILQLIWLIPVEYTFLYSFLIIVPTVSSLLPLYLRLLHSV